MLYVLGHSHVGTGTLKAIMETDCLVILRSYITFSESYRQNSLTTKKRY